MGSDALTGGLEQLVVDGSGNRVPIQTNSLGQVSHTEFKLHETHFDSLGEISLCGSFFVGSRCGHHLETVLSGQFEIPSKKFTVTEEFKTPFHQLLRVTRKQLGLTQEEMGKRLGVSGNWISLLESGNEEKARPSDQLIMSVQRMSLDPPSRIVESTMICEDLAPCGKTRMIPVIGWAHAGSAESYEEVPSAWQCMIPTECRDTKAFAVSLEGDSMEPRFSDGDLIIVQPSETAYSGCFVVAKFVNDGVIFRRIEMSGPAISLVPLNERYSVSTHAAEEFAWIYPVWGRWTQIWRR